jgi:g-D-glutamyl-meso-diaminopimelate peptidase
VTTPGGKVGWCLSRYLAKEADPGSFKPVSSSLLDWPSEYINLSLPFTYQRCMQDMNEIAAAYAGMARVETIGNSVMGNPIDAIVLGNPDADTRILIQASMHARESITSLLALRQAECMLKAASMDASYKGVRVSDLLDSVEIWVVPMANPDGVRLVYEGLSAVPSSMPGLKAMNHGRTDFTHWKANADGVDLNKNFDANWKVDPKYSRPGMQNYAGPYAFSEPEAIALRDLTVSKDFALTMSYHSSGKLIYWYGPADGPNGLNRYIANELKSLTGYTVLPVSAQAPNGGYRDWYTGQYKRPGFTLEVGTGYCPLPLSSFSGIWKDNRYVLLDLAWIVAPKSLSSYGN